MDRFDDIWKNRFNEEQLPEDEWINPGEEVWAQIADQIEPRPRKRRRWIFWLFSLGLVALLSAGWFVWPNSEQRLTEQMEEKSRYVSTNLPTAKTNLSSTANDSEEQQSTVSTIAPTVTLVQSQSKLSTADEPVATPANIREVSATASSVPASVGHPSIIKQQSITTYNNDRKVFSRFSGSEERVTLRTTKSSIPAQLTTPNNQNHSLLFEKTFDAGIELPTLFAANLPTTSAWEAPQGAYQVDWPLPKTHLPIQISLNAGAVYWQHRITEAFQNDFAPFDFNHTDNWGWQVNLGLEIPINSFLGVYTGLQYEQVQVRSGHNSELAYEVVNEPAEQAKNDYALSLATPYGLTPAEFSFIRTQGLNSEAVNLLVDFESKHLLRNLSIPLGLSIYPMGRKHRIVPVLRAGIGVNYLAGIQNDLNFIQTNHDAISFVKETATVEQQTPYLNRWHLDYRVGLGLNYSLNQNMQVQLNYNWSRGINPIYELNNHATRIDRHFFSVGIQQLLHRN
ncbi:MAG: hypothetical protein AAGD05_07920 [Bacteroidota bacterium]